MSTFSTAEMFFYENIFNIHIHMYKKLITFLIIVAFMSYEYHF